MLQFHTVKRMMFESKVHGFTIAELLFQGEHRPHGAVTIQRAKTCKNNRVTEVNVCIIGDM